MRSILSLSFSRRLLSTLFLCILGVSMHFTSILVVSENFVTNVYAEDSDSYLYYKNKINSLLQDIESEFRVNNAVSDSSLSTLRSLASEAYARLPDGVGDAEANLTTKKSIDLYIDLSAKNKTSETHTRNLVTRVKDLIEKAKIQTIAGSITANPVEGNAPLTTSFLATARDPSGVNIPDGNYIWWMRENGGYRRELGRGPTLTYSFSREGTYQVFLDVVSGSRNSKGKTDVVPLSTSQEVRVLPRVGNIILLVNGVNVSNLETLKINPTIGKIGIIFDATASRATSNGTITKTKWIFGNGNEIVYDGGPLIERQLFVNEGNYKVSLEITTNQNQTFKKDLQLIVRDPSAVISVDKDVGYIGDDFRMTARSYFANDNNIKYSWKVQNASSSDGKAVYSQEGSNFSYKFQNIGQYIVSLTARSPNGAIDNDSHIITIEAHEPVVNLDSPKPISSERPNVFLFDASRSLDPDSNSAKNLTYTWSIDGEKVTLDGQQRDGAIGTYVFSDKGQHTISLTVSNASGKVKTVEKTFEVASTLSVGLNIVPRAAPLGTTVNIQARSPRARFFEWDLGDGTPSVNGTVDHVEHIYKKTGIYSVYLTVKNSDGTETSRIERKVYVTDAGSPFALIDVRNNGNAIEDPLACGPEGAILINRAESTTIDGGNSINIDGTTSGLSYTWRYLDRIKTGPSLSEKFSELGCFPIELTVKSDRTGASHTTKKYVQIKNIPPKITSIDTNIDTTKKDSQKIIINVSANGARDEDGVITSYIWYYFTESDSEPQNIRITQSPKATFVVPNVTEKYTFGVILEDNDGARINSKDILSDQVPLIITNDAANMNMPLITLTTPKSQILTGEPIDFRVSAKNIMGTDITPKSEYQWDFDGDGKIDKKTSEPKVTYTYKSSGNYTMKVKVTYNGTSNSKYQLINVRNELKASAKGYRSGDTIFLLNTSQGSYDRALWKVGDREIESLSSVMIPQSSLSGSSPIILTIQSGDTESSSVEISPNRIEDTSSEGGSGVMLQTYPLSSGNVLTLGSRGDRLVLSFFGNEASEYIVDTDTKIDSDLDGLGDNDIDNKNSPSYKDGSAYLVEGITDSQVREREMKITLKKNGVVTGTRIMKVVLDYIPDTSKDAPKDISGSGMTSFSSLDKENLEKLQSKIRTLESSDRIVLTQKYNTLIEGWDDLHDRTQGLIDIQEYISNSSITDSLKNDFSSLIDTILIGDAKATDEVGIATRVIEGLISKDEENKAYILERLQKIKSHPGNLTENKLLGEEILKKIENSEKINTGDKLSIKNQLRVITSGGQGSAPVISREDTPSTAFGILRGFMKILGIIFAIILGLVLLAYIFYRISNKSKDTGFQDFLIDSVVHPKNASPKNTETPSIVVAPLTNRPITVSQESVPPSPPVVQNIVVNVPPQEDVPSSYPASDPLKIASLEAPSSSVAPPVFSPSHQISGELPQKDSLQSDTLVSEEQSIPDWLKPMSPEKKKEESISQGQNTLLSGDPLAEVHVSVASPSLIVDVPAASHTGETKEEILPSSQSPLGEIHDSPLDTLEPAHVHAIDGSSLVIHDSSAPTEAIPESPPSLEGGVKEQSLDEISLTSLESPGVALPASVSSQDPLLPVAPAYDPALIPDWLHPTDGEDSNTPALSSQVQAEDIPPPPPAELPDWLREGIGQSSDTPKKPKNPPKKKIQKKPTNLSSLEEKGSENTSPPSNKDHDIPDWLK